MTKKMDRLAELMRNIDPERLGEALVKSESLTIRITLSDKRAMMQVAKACGLTMTEYVMRLHYLAEQGLVEWSEGKAPKGRGRK